MAKAMVRMMLTLREILPTEPHVRLLSCWPTAADRHLSGGPNTSAGSPMIRVDITSASESASRTLEPGRRVLHRHLPGATLRIRVSAGLGSSPRSERQIRRSCPRSLQGRRSLGQTEVDNNGVWFFVAGTTAHDSFTGCRVFLASPWPCCSPRASRPWLRRTPTILRRQSSNKPGRPCRVSSTTTSARRCATRS